MTITPRYTTSATATGGRDGKAATDDGSFSVTLAVPKELGGNGQGNNPEQLFASGYAACFLGAMKFAATQDKTLPRVPSDASVRATVGIGPRDDKGFGLTVELAVTLPGVDRAAGEALIAEADTICPYSHATRGNISVSLTLA
ncbi:organic hydroperoxide resistance protein [Novosphingobium humi]|uniref:Organic hydroperoxide resistance protein n=1 Tax=Novosphingobium humi TaxID=2282397 RepID=A0ABY7TSK1_9SPHN|nr:organic hydroperoxide resistance protein [Novosphingobium humi]WCT76177.1 organic hydroperoxide resistance protein [Novosphingobium humi]WJS97361.1 organic hydroperoxide resistance protein [Novosphingobium humi]